MRLTENNGSIGQYNTQEKRPIKLFRYGDIARDSILDELNAPKEERLAGQEQFAQYTASNKQLIDIANAEIKLNEFCERARKNPKKFTFEDKLLALDALDIKVTPTRNRIDIGGAIPIDISQAGETLLTTGQTSGSLFCCRHSYIEDIGYKLAYI